jgi:hypothetical protein
MIKRRLVHRGIDPQRIELLILRPHIDSHQRITRSDTVIVNGALLAAGFVADTVASLLSVVSRYSVCASAIRVSKIAAQTNVTRLADCNKRCDRSNIRRFQRNASIRNHFAK